MTKSSLRRNVALLAFLWVVKCFHRCNIGRTGRLKNQFLFLKSIHEACQQSAFPAKGSFSFSYMVCYNSIMNMQVKNATEYLSHVPAPLLAWYDQNARVLPWRRQPTPYRVWVSEIMLQQTRVEAGKPYFERFVQAFPGFAELAAAEDEQLLKLWEGLGYYNRARNMKKAAEIVTERFGGEMPGEYEKILSLPGIGEYTAGAVASIAFGLPVPAVDGNVLRVLSRVLENYEDILSAETRTAFRQMLLEVIPKDRAGDFNQALMELGALICVPGAGARCAGCPLEGICLAGKKGLAAEIPRKSKRAERVKEEKTVFLLIYKNTVALQKRPKGLLGGMWEFPGAEGWLSRDEAEDWLKGKGIAADSLEQLPAAEHVFTHREWHMRGYLAMLREMPQADGFFWADAAALKERIALPSAFKAYYVQAMRVLEKNN